MWLVEINVLGRRFTHRVDRPRALRRDALLPHRRQARQSDPRAAA